MRPCNTSALGSRKPRFLQIRDNYSICYLIENGGQFTPTGFGSLFLSQVVKHQDVIAFAIGIDLGKATFSGKSSAMGMFGMTSVVARFQIGIYKALNGTMRNRCFDDIAQQNAAAPLADQCPAADRQKGSSSECAAGYQKSGSHRR